MLGYALRRFDNRLLKRTGRLKAALRTGRPKAGLRRGHRWPRRGATLVWFALLLVVLLAMAGLVIDAGLLLAARRQAQNAADAAVAAPDVWMCRPTS